MVPSYRTMVYHGRPWNTTNYHVSFGFRPCFVGIMVFDHSISWSSHNSSWSTMVEHGSSWLNKVIYIRIVKLCGTRIYNKHPNRCPACLFSPSPTPYGQRGKGWLLRSLMYQVGTRQVALILDWFYLSLSLSVFLSLCPGVPTFVCLSFCVCVWVCLHVCGQTDQLEVQDVPHRWQGKS